MMNNFLSISLLVVIGSMIFMSYDHKNEIESLKKTHSEEMKILEMKHAETVKLMKGEYVKLNDLYTRRTLEVIDFQNRQEKIMEELSKLEDMAKTEPETVEKVINNTFDNYMREVYNETHSNDDVTNN